MSNESQTTANAPSDPVLCKMGCGFFGSGATGDCCSKCWRENMKKQGVCAEPAPAPVVESRSEPEPMDVEMEDVKPAVPEVKAPVPAPSAEAAHIKKKKKKTSYKNLMANMTKSSPTRDVEKEKEQLQKGLGGGAFSKIDKI